MRTRLPHARRRTSASITPAVTKAMGEAAGLLLPLSLLASLLLSESLCALLAAVSAVLLHEAGHLFCFLILGEGAPRLGLDTAGLRLYPREELRGGRLACVLVGGPLANLLGALLFCRAGADFLGTMHLCAALFNLLPIGTSDGGRLLLWLLGLLFPVRWAKRIHDGVTLLLLSFFFFFGLFSFYMTGHGLIAVFFSLFSFVEHFGGQLNDF